MSPATKRTLAIVSSLAAMVTIASGVSLSVQYKPYGVPDVLRPEYERKVADIRERQYLFQNADKLGEAIAYMPTTEYDFGMLDPQSTASHKFVIRNEGAASLALELGSSTCKCTAGKLEANVLQPGEQTSVELKWNTGNKVGNYEQSAFLLTSDPTSPEIEIKVKGEIKGALLTPNAISFPQTNPAETTHVRFLVSSQIWKGFEVEGIECPAEDFMWYAERVASDDPRLADKQATSGVEVHVFTTPLQHQKFSGSMELRVRPEDETDTIVRTVSYTGKTRAPIGFYGQDIHFQDGLDIGTLTNNKTHRFNLLVRTNGEKDRTIKVIDVEPKIIKASLMPLKAEGTYRLTLEIPQGVRTTIFNTPQKHGYVQVGDPADRKHFANWFPVHGAVVEPSK